MQRTPTILIPAYLRLGFTRFLELVVLEMRGHVAESDDLAAEVAVGCACSVGEFVRCEAGDQ